jgi:hypothetical protein
VFYSYCSEFDNGFIHTVLRLIMALLILFWVWQCVLLILQNSMSKTHCQTQNSMSKAIVKLRTVWVKPLALYSYCFEFDNGFIHTVLSLTMWFIHTVLSLTMALFILFWVWQCTLLILFWVWQWLYSYCFEFDNGFIHTVLSLTMVLFILFWV